MVISHQRFTHPCTEAIIIIITTIIISIFVISYIVFEVDFS